MGMDETESMFDSFSSAQNPNERDVPANQLFQNLEEIISEKMDVSNQSFAEKLKVEKKLISYVEALRKLTRNTRLKFPKLSQASFSDLDKIQGLEQRQQIMAEMAFTKSVMQKLEYAGEQAKMLHIAYEELLYGDKRIKPELCDQLIIRLKPAAQTEAFKKINKSDGLSYLVDEPVEAAKPIASMLSSENVPISENMALVRCDDQLLQKYIKTYHTLEVIYMYVASKLKHEGENMKELDSELRKRGGPLTQKELKRIDDFVNGTDLNYIVGDKLALLDFLRVQAEKYIK